MKKRKNDLNEIKNKINTAIKYLENNKSIDKKTVKNLVKNINELQIAASNKNDSLFRTTLYSIGDGVITTNTNGIIQHMNPVAERLCGWKEADAKDKLLEIVFKIINEITKKKRDSPIKRVLKSRHSMSLANHTILISKSGMQIPIADSCAPIKNDSGEIIGIVLVFRDQTEEREKQNALKERERKYSTLVSNLPGFIYRCANDKDWTMDFISDGCKNVTGYSAKDFIHSKKLAYNDIIHPDYQEQIWKEWQKILKKKIYFEFEYPVITKSSKIKWVWERGRGVYSKEGKLLFLEGFIEDISYRRNIGESLRLKNIVFESSITANSISNPDGKLIDANAAFLKFWGYTSKSKVLGKSLNAFIKNKNDVVTILSILNKKGVWEGEFIARRSDKSEFIAYGLATTIVDENGKIIGYQSSVLDVTDRNKTEELLKESETRYKSFFDNSPDAIFLADPETGKIIDANKAALNLLKLRKSMVVGMHQSQLHPKRLENYSRGTFSKQIKVKDLKIPIENFLVNSSGEEIPVEVLAAALKINGKTVIQGVFRNISERRKIEKALLESENKFQLFFEQSKDAMLLLDGKVFFDCNKAAVEMLGYAEKSQILSSHPAQLSPEFQPDGIASLAKAGKIINQAYKDGFIQFEWVHRKKDGENLSVEVMLTSIPLAGKQILFTVWRDITSRKKAEQDLLYSERMLLNVVDNFPGVVFWKDLNSTYLGSNQAFAIAAGLNNSSEIVGKTDFDLPWAKTEANNYRTDDKQVMDDKIKKIRIIETQHQAGNRIAWFDTNKVPLFDNLGKVVGVLGTSNDITERKLSEDKLRESEISYRGLFNSVSEAIYILDGNGVFIDINQGALAMYGYEQNELIGKTPEFVSAPNKNDLASVVVALQKAFKGEKQRFDFWGKRKNGEVFLKDVRLYPGKYFNEKVIIAIANDITEKKKIEEALAISEERYRAISNLTSDYLFSTVVNENGIHELVWIAGSFEIITGYTMEEYKALGGWRAALHPDELLIDDLDSEKLRRNENVYREIRTYHKNGSLVWVKSHAHPVWDNKNNKLIGIYGAVEDVTLHKQTEIVQKIQYKIADAVVTFKTLTELFETIRKELSAIINVNNFFIALFDEKTGMLRSDVDKDEVDEISEWQAKGSMTGYVIEQKKSILLKKDEINKLIETGEAGMIGVIPEIWLGVPFKIGGIVFGVLVVQSYDNPKAYDQRGLEILEIVAHELSIFIKHKKAEEDTLKLSTAIVQSPTIVVITDPGGIIEYVNPKFSEVTGYSSDEAKGNNHKFLKSGTHTKKFYSDLWNTILSGNIWQGEIQNKKKNGELYWENVLISPIIDSDGHITYFVAVKEDITEKKKMIEELIVAKEKAEEMNRIKSSFFANMSHELRTPMVGILGFSEFLSNELKDNPEYFHMISSINISGRRLLETLNLILNLSKLEASKVEVELQSQNIIPILKESFGFFESAAAKKNIDYTFVSEHNEIVCSIDQLLFSSIFNNLLNNAIKFTDSGSVILSVSADTSYATISVMDTGVGISETKQNLIWEEFRQASEGYNRGFEGTGLGLTIAKKYTDLMYGSVSVKSSLGKGTTFIVSFPLINQSSDFVSPLKEYFINKPVEQEKINPSIKILYVEDDEISVKYVATVTKSFYTIDAAKDSDEALNKIKQHQYDVILMDINLRRGMDGLELTKVIRKIKGYESTPIIAITAFAMGHEKEEFLSKGMTHYLSKPFVKKQLFDVLESAINSKE